MERQGHSPPSQGVEDSLIGQVIDERYHVKGKLGAGGVGVVYEAEHVKLRRNVAVKVLQREYAARQPLRRRFEREARAMAALDHPNIVQVTDFGVWEDLPFLVMELLEGRSLKDRIAAGRLGSQEVLEIAGQVLRAAAFAHESGLVHRDLKPGNVVLAERADGEVLVNILDFGLAKFVANEGGPDGTPNLTVTGMAFGTPAYMAPEQAAGGPTDHRTDLYSIGVMLFELITGTLPFHGDAAEMMRQHLFAAPPRVAEFFHVAGRDVSDGLEAFFEKVLAKERSKRFQTALQMSEAFEQQAGALGDLLDVGAQSDATAQTIFAGVDGATPATITDDAGMTSATTPGVPLAFAATDPAEVDSTVPTLRSSSTRRRALWFVIASTVVLSVVLGATLAVWNAIGDGETDGAHQPLPSHGELETPRPIPEASTPPPRDNEDTIGNEESPPLETFPLSQEAERVDGAAERGIWDDPQPSLIAEAKARVDGGGRIDEGMARRLLGHAWKNKNDARPLLLLARYRIARSHLTDAVDRYEKAYAADSRARTDPHMLRDLVDLARSRSVGWRAARAVKNIFGQAAIPTVDEALNDPALEAQESRRLRKLRGELNRMSR